MADAGYPRLSEVTVRLAPSIAILTASLGALATIAPGAGPKQLTEATFDAMRDEILPRKDEERWREIPWRTSTWEAVVEAAATEKPVLLWAMNGHPLACT